MNKKEILLIGGGGHCRACIDVIEQTGMYTIKGIVDKAENLHKSILGYEVIGTDTDLIKLSKKIKFFLITIGQIKSSSKRQSLYNSLRTTGSVLPLIISPLAYVSKHSLVGDGTIIMHNAVINACAKIGSNCIINTKAVIEHDVCIGNHCHISTGALVNGEVQIKNCCFIGSNATIRETRSICNNVVVGAGVTVIRDITEPGIFVNNTTK